MIFQTEKIHETAIIDEGAIIGENCKIWHWTHISGGAVIGDNCIFGQNVFGRHRDVQEDMGAV